MIFSRSAPSRPYKNYGSYREYTRRDFLRFCAYCFLHESELGGDQHFEQDHFEPREKKPERTNDYLNLYWSCRACNSRQNKGNHWPTQAEQAAGSRFCDPCDHDVLIVDYREEADGSLTPLTTAGTYTARVLRLRERTTLEEMRGGRRQLRVMYSEYEARIGERLERVSGGRVDADAREMIEVARRALTEIRAYLDREPFYSGGVPRVDGVIGWLNGGEVRERG